jgi:hypothetical protein
MKKSDNFDASKWLVENKVTTQSRLNEAITINPVKSIEDYGFVKIRNKEEYLQAIPKLTQAGYTLVGGKFPTNPTPFDQGYGSYDGYGGRKKERKNSIYLVKYWEDDPSNKYEGYLWFADVLDKNKISDKFPIGTPYSLG